jgi:hypothetical protein
MRQQIAGPAFPVLLTVVICVNIESTLAPPTPPAALVEVENEAEITPADGAILVCC